MKRDSERSLRAPSLRMLGRIVLAAIEGWIKHRAASRAAALAFYALLSLAPTLVLMVAIAGSFVSAQSVRGDLLNQIRGLVGEQGAMAVQAILVNAHDEHRGALAGLISGVVILVSATSAFAELKSSLDELWEVPRHVSSGIWGLLRERLLSLSIVLVLALLLLISLTVNAGLGSLARIWGEYWAQSAFALVAGVVSDVFSFLIVTALFGAIYKLLPDTRIAWRDVNLGALVTAMLFTLGKAGIGFYLGHGAIGSAYGGAGSLVVLLAWTYYSSAIFFFGALLTNEFAFVLGSRAGERRDASAAVESAKTPS